ncbi:very short patch repair endonuclease [Erwinia sp. QL-Z3]|uniref:very short patch repair endonuclease n=1 Tax=Erwinia sp. QL-Z3 TaxID=2547962 RepID=UPI001070D7A3|nr:DNA mismatch endonuclease Vsr [Erwinia sp. QL-Z3]QBR52213.1 DNA mismatch endonuclease Vsr [Erwinia sp. QL-Z3]
MADVHSSEIRSKNMRAIRTRDTAIETRLAELLTGLGLHYRVQDKALPGRPDFVLDEYHTIIFVHGCFWHKHHCHLFKVPATRTAFWLGKIDSNVARDKRYIAELSAAGWKVLLVWECALRGKTRLEEDAMTSRLEEGICAGKGNGEIDSQGIRQI